MAKRMAVYVESVPVRFRSGKWEREERRRTVIVMAQADGYSMVRIPRCLPFVVRTKDLQEADK